MKGKKYQKFLKLTTKQVTDNASVIVLIREYESLLTNSRNEMLYSSIYNKLMTLFFQNNNLAKKHVLAVLKKHKKRFKTIDPIVYKTEILNNLLGIDRDCSKYVLKYIKLFKEKFVSDFEIVAEVEHFSYKTNIFGDDHNDEISKTNAIVPKNDIDSIVAYIENHKDKNTVKMLIKYPILCQFARRIEVDCKHFLNLREARKLYQNFGIFEPEWNKNKFVKISFTNAVVDKRFVYLFHFLIKYIKQGNKTKCNIILDIFISTKNIKQEYKIMFQYLHNIANNIVNDMCAFACDFYGVKDRCDFKSLKKQFIKMKETI